MNAMQALNRARAAWARHDHQLELQFYEDELEESLALDRRHEEPKAASVSVSGAVVASPRPVPSLERASALAERERAGYSPTAAAPACTDAPLRERVIPSVTHSSQCRTPPSSGQADGSALVKLEGEDAVRPEACRVLPTGGYAR